MALGISAAAWAAVAATATIVGTAYSIYNGQQNANAQRDAAAQAQANANAQLLSSQQALNRANQKQPDTSAILSAAMQSGRMGASGTMLTGPQGINPSTLNLGKTTLLGG